MQKVVFMKQSYIGQMKSQARLAAQVFFWAAQFTAAALMATHAYADSDTEYEQTNLVSDVAGLASVTDTNLQGAWGITRSATSPWWVNSTASGLSLLFDGTGQPIPLIVAVPPTNGATPTGIVFNGGNGFQVASNKPARFIFVTLNGTISGWSSTQVIPKVAELKVNNTGHAGYTGAALAQLNGADTLYVANYFGNRIELFDTNYDTVGLAPDAFTDPDVPPSLSVFNIQLVGDVLFVTYAPTNVLGLGGGPGQGFVSSFNTDGSLIGHLRHGPWMDAPWGVTLAPDNFGRFSNDLLVGMFASGHIAAFDSRHGQFDGFLEGVDGQPITIGTGKGLWGLGFGNGATAGPTNSLYFAADIVTQGVFHGLFGALNTVSGHENEGHEAHGNRALHQGDQNE